MASKEGKMKTYLMVLDERRPLEYLLSKLKEDLQEAKFHKEKLGVHFLGDESVGSAVALEIMAILEFYGNGILCEFKSKKKKFDIINHSLLEYETLIIDYPTILKGDVDKGALLIINEPLYVTGVFAGTAVLKSMKATLFANIYCEAKIRTPRCDYLRFSQGAHEFSFIESSHG